MTPEQQARFIRQIPGLRELVGCGRLQASDILDALSIIDSQAATIAALQSGRVDCACGKDTASVKNAQCYQCRNKPYWDIEALEAQVAALQRCVVDLMEGMRKFNDYAFNPSMYWNAAVEKHCKTISESREAVK